jgi:hypothetical protein
MRACPLLIGHNCPWLRGGLRTLGIGQKLTLISAAAYTEFRVSEAILPPVSGRRHGAATDPQATCPPCLSTFRN